ncbi:MAG: LysM peptidoglycan-binding domain-containing protein [Candidatus Electrothrix sp. AUS1_2]|nr:LysM peptidoglycan-binding domain-containing protein [Candidatus Electrothrix sp. AUS1_2]
MKKRLDTLRRREDEFLFQGGVHDQEDEEPQASIDEKKNRYFKIGTTFFLPLLLFIFLLWFFIFRHQEGPRGKFIESESQYVKVDHEGAAKKSSVIQRSTPEATDAGPAAGNHPDVTKSAEESAYEDEDAVQSQDEAEKIEQLKQELLGETDEFQAEKRDKNIEKPELPIGDHVDDNALSHAAEEPDDVVNKEEKDDVKEKKISRSVDTAEEDTGRDDSIRTGVTAVLRTIKISKIAEDAEAVRQERAVGENEPQQQEVSEELAKVRPHQDVFTKLLEKNQDKIQDTEEKERIPPSEKKRPAQSGGQREKMIAKSGADGADGKTEQKNVVPTPIAKKVTELTHHTVSKGETLWKISEQYTGSGFNYPDVAKKNKISNPDLIYPDQQVELPAKK